MSHHQHCPCMTCSDKEDAIERHEEHLKTLDWEIDDEYECVDTDTFNGTCKAEDGDDTYAAYCTINRGSGDVTGTIVEIDYASAEKE